MFHASGHIHGEWFSLPNSAYQNMCLCFEVTAPGAAMLREKITDLRGRFRQDSVAWAPAATTFL